MTDDEWGPWIEHDGKGCPVVGMYVWTERDTVVTTWVGSPSAILDGKYVIYRVHPQSEGSWHWTPGFGHVIRYRIRKPRAMEQIRALLEDLPERVDA